MVATQTQTLQVTCIRKSGSDGSHEGITHLGGSWGTWTREQVIRAIEARTHSFYTSVNGKSAWIGVREGRYGKYVQTYADGQWTNNLLALPICW